MKRTQPIEWHRQCLVNSVGHAQRLREAYIRAGNDYDVARNNCLMYEAQIKEAERLGKKEFNRDAFMKKRRATAPQQREREGSGK